MLQITNLSISLNVNDRVILKDFTFSLNRGDRAVIIGEEGNGKSTLLKLIYNPALVSSYASYSGVISTGGEIWQYILALLADKHGTLDLPDHEVEALARTFLPDILAFFQSEEGKKEFEEWKKERENKTHASIGNQKSKDGKTVNSSRQ